MCQEFYNHYQQLSSASTHITTFSNQNIFRPRVHPRVRPQQKSLYKRKQVYNIGINQSIDV